MSDFLERFRWFFVALLAAPLALGVGLLLADRLNDPDPLELQIAELPAGEIRVYVTGAVKSPGVYSLSSDDRWIDAVDAAGGATDDADLSAIDLARRARDEDTVLVPRMGQPAVAGAVQGPLIDINTAGREELESLPGIGEMRAQSIIRSREDDGSFGSTDELLERDLIPASVYEDIMDLITVGLPADSPP